MEEEEEQGGGGEGWLVSFADLMTLLFAAFVVLYGTLEVGRTDRLYGVTAAIREAFVEIPDASPTDDSIGKITKGKFVFKAYEGDTDIDKVKYDQIKDDPKVAIDRDRSRVDRMLDQIATKNNTLDFGMRRSMNTEVNELGFTIRLMGAYFFEPGGYRFSREGRKRFLQLGKLMKTLLQRKFIIEGHTDSHPTKGQFDNQAIGSLRSGNAVRLLIEELGMSASRLESISYGSERPISSNQTPEGRQQNRRIEIKVIGY